jgi:hypothetical protein
MKEPPLLPRGIVGRRHGDIAANRFDAAYDND